MNLHLSFRPLAAALAVCSLAIPACAHADTVAWTQWTMGGAGNPGTAAGTIASGSSVSVTYSGQTSGLSVNYPSWTPAGSFSGGTVGDAPPAAYGAVALQGGSAYTETITFSSAIVDPVMAIWSLGAPGDPASFNFTGAEPFSIQAGGGSAEYGGSTITQVGNNVYGSEGDGVIQFSGTYTSLSFTTPTYENYYVFTVGADTSASTAVTPEPATLSLLGLGLASLPVLRRKLSRSRE